MIFELDYQQLVSTKILKTDTAVILNVDPEGNVFRNDGLYEKTKLMPLNLLKKGAKAVVSEQVKSRAINLGYESDKMVLAENIDFINSQSLYALPAAFLNTVLSEMKLPLLNKESWIKISNSLPAGRANTIKINDKLTIINDGASKGLLPVNNLLTYLKTIYNAVLITNRKEIEDDEITIIYCEDNSSNALKEAVKTALKAELKIPDVIAYSPGTAKLGEEINSIQDRIDKYELYIRKYL